MEEKSSFEELMISLGMPEPPRPEKKKPPPAPDSLWLSIQAQKALPPRTPKGNPKTVEKRGETMDGQGNRASFSHFAQDLARKESFKTAWETNLKKEPPD